MISARGISRYSQVKNSVLGLRPLFTFTANYDKITTSRCPVFKISVVRNFIQIPIERFKHQR